MYTFKLLLTLVSVLAIDALKWKDCGGSNAIVHPQNIQLSEPITIRNFTVGGRVVIDKELLPGTRSRIEIWRILKPLFIPILIKIPCQLIGLCEYDMCRETDDNLCKFRQTYSNSTCGCPIAPQTIEGYNFRPDVPNITLPSAANVIISILSFDLFNLNDG